MTEPVLFVIDVVAQQRLVICDIACTLFCCCLSYSRTPERAEYVREVSGENLQPGASKLQNGRVDETITSTQQW
jgi:hypothetical protein